MTRKSEIKDRKTQRMAKSEELKAVIHGHFAEKRRARTGGSALKPTGHKEWIRGGAASLMLLGGAGIFHGVAYASGNAEATVEQEASSALRQDEVPLEEQAQVVQQQQEEVTTQVGVRSEATVAEEEVTHPADAPADVQEKDEKAAQQVGAPADVQDQEEEKPMISAARRAYIPEN